MKNKKKRNLIIVAVIAALIVIGSIGNAFKKDEPAEPAAQAQSAKHGLTLPDYSGKTLDIAYAELTAAGVKYKAVDTVDDASVWSPKNWVIESHKPAAGVSVAEGTTVTFKVSKPGAAEDKAKREKAAKETGPSETTQGLTGTYAQAACDMYAEQEYPYGFKAHWITGKLAERVEGDRYFLKVEADITNAFGAEAKGMNMECFVSGTNDAPDVVEFNVY